MLPTLPRQFRSLFTSTLLIVIACLLPFAQSMVSNPYVSGIKLPGNRIEDQTLFSEVKSVIGGRAELPCNLTLPSPDDAIQLIFWYRGNNSRVPIYTVDSRTSSLPNATHFPSDTFLPHRALFELHSQPIASLQIEPVDESDHGEYRCRVDYRYGRTINSFVSLHVIVPPKRIAIRDQNGNYVQNSTIGPYNQDDDVMLTCESFGGIPPPTLLWYKDGVMIDGSYVVGKNGTVSNELTIYRLSARHLHDRYTCQAANFNSSGPIEAYVTLDINLLPVSVRIMTSKEPVLANRKMEVRCETYGSKPAATIRWLKNNVSLSHGSETHQSNKSSSSITLMPSMEDNKAHLRCRAYNTKLADKYIEDAWTLQVLYKPHVVLSVDSSIASSVVVHEGHQIVIECKVAANPGIADLQILHNSKPIYRRDHLDVYQDNATRVLIEAANSTHRGRYQCVASNREGLTNSNEVQLNVRHVPNCANSIIESASHYALAINETVRLKCQVEASPHSHHFYWTINEDSPQNGHFISESSNSNELIFTLDSLHKYGKVRCWAKNEVGLQQKPCVFILTKAGPPSPLTSCSVTNKTTTSLTVECIPGDSGGSAQIFHANVLIAGNQESIAENDQDQGDSFQSQSAVNLTEQSPTFYLNQLSPGTSYMIELYASNARGQSDLTRLSVTTLFTKNTKLISSSLQEIEYDPIYSVFVGALLAVVLVVIVAFISCRLRQRQISRRNKQKEEQIKQNFAFRPPSPNQSYVHQDKSTIQPSSLPNESGHKPDIISFEELSNSKLNLYVINEIKEEPMRLSRQEQQAQMMGGGGSEPTLMPFNPNCAHMYQQPFLSSSSVLGPSTSQLMASEAVLGRQCLQPHIQPPHSHTSHFFISPPTDAILYTSAASLRPQILSINDKIADGIVLNGTHYGYYHADNVQTAINETIVLHHQPVDQIPHPGQPQEQGKASLQDSQINAVQSIDRGYPSTAKQPVRPRECDSHPEFHSSRQNTVHMPHSNKTALKLYDLQVRQSTV